jgi:hypothetical protein
LKGADLQIMSDGIQSIRYVPQIKQVSPKERNRGRKDGKEGGQEFAEYIQGSDEDEKNEKHNKDDPVQRRMDKGMEWKEDSQKTSNLNEECGVIIDIEA